MDTAIEAAEEMLSSFEITFDEDGDAIRWAYFADEVWMFYTFDADDAQELADLLLADPANGYSFWCQSYGEEMSDDEVRGLRTAAGEAGDRCTVRLCDMHLDATDTEETSLARIIDVPRGYGLSDDRLDYIDESGPTYATKKEAKQMAAHLGYTHVMGITGKIERAH